MGRAFKYLLDPMTEQGVDDQFILYTNAELTQEFSSRQNVTTRMVSGSLVPVYEQFHLRSQVNSDLPDVLWCPANTGPVRVRVPIVVTIHDVIFRHRGSLLPHSSSPYQRLGRLYTDWSATKLAKRAAHVVTDSRFSAKQICELLHAEPEHVSVVTLGSTLSALGTGMDNGRLQALGLDAPFFFCLGATDPRKNTTFAIEAFLNSPVAGQTLFTLAGLSSSDQQSLKSKIREHPNSGRIRLLDFVSDDDLAGLYKTCLAFVFPSLYEGFGLPVLEAMQFGAPIICSNQTSVPEVGGEAVLYFDPRSKSELTKCLETLHSDKILRTSLSKKSQKRAMEFSWAESATNMLNILRTAAK